MLRLMYAFILLSLFVKTETTAQTLSIGPMVGMNVSKISNIDNAANLTGFSLGAFANYSINEHVGLGVKLLYSQLGTGLENSTLTSRLNYLQLPITGIYFFGNAGNKFRPKIYAGPYIGALLSAKDNDGDAIENVFKKSDIGGLIGVGFNYLIKSRTWLNVDAGYSGSFVNIAEVANTDYKNTALSLAVGVSFPIDGE